MDAPIGVESLDFLYTPSRDVAADVTAYTAVLDASLVFAIEDGGIRVAMVELPSGPPAILLTDHVEGERPILVYRVTDLSHRRGGAARARMGPGPIARAPARAVRILPLAGRAPLRVLRAGAPRRPGAFRRSPGLLSH